MSKGLTKPGHAEPARVGRRRERPPRPPPERRRHRRSGPPVRTVQLAGAAWATASPPRASPRRRRRGAAARCCAQAEPILNIFRGLPPGTISPASIDVAVRNGSGVPGQAADVAAALETIGFVITGVSSYPSGPMAITTVSFGDGGEAAARRVARHITGGAPADATTRGCRRGQVVVVTGLDLTTIHDQPAPEGSPDDLRSTTSTTTTRARPRRVDHHRATHHDDDDQARRLLHRRAPRRGELRLI